MKYFMIFLISSTLLLLTSSPAYAQTANPPSLSPTPAPAPSPAPAFVNLTDLLSVAGPFQTFLNYLQSTEVIDTFQNQANNTQQGITIFAPRDNAFSSLKKPSLSKLTQDQFKSLILFHALPRYYSLADFKNLGQSSPVNTFAGGQYSLNFTDVSGTPHITSGWSNTKVSSSVYSTNPVAVYEIGKVLLPEAIFGTDIPPTPAPAPAPDIAPVADAEAPSKGKDSAFSSTASTQSSSSRVIGWGIFGSIALGVSGGMAFLL